MACIELDKLTGDERVWWRKGIRKGERGGRGGMKGGRERERERALLRTVYYDGILMSRVKYLK